MSSAKWLTAALVFLFIVFIILGIGFYIRNNSNGSPQPLGKYNAPLGWGQPISGPNPDKNTCQLYTFPTANVIIDGVETAIPGLPTFNANILNGLTGTVSYPSCLDTDQTYAQQVQHTCIAPVGVVDGQITRCFLLNGGTTGLNGTEVYYNNDNCPATLQCPGQLSLVSVNFQSPNQPDIYCIKSTNNNAIMQPCDPSDSDQLFRITRIQKGQNPNGLQPGSGQNGLFAQIYNRNNNTCLTAGTGSSSTTYSGSYLTGTSCTGTINFSGTNVVTDTCQGGEFPGYVWLFLPSTFWCGPTACTGGNGSIVPPQIVYIGNYNVDDIPTGTTGYRGLVGNQAIVQWLVDNNAKSLYWGGSGTGLILSDLATDVSVCTQKPSITQYMNLSIYNTIQSQAVCLAENNTSTCVTF